MFGRIVLFLLWVSLVMPEQDEASVFGPVRHRPGATLIAGPTVSPTTGVYRLIIDLPTYDFSTELSTLKSFVNISETSLGLLQTLHNRNSTPSFATLDLKKKLALMYHSLLERLQTAVANLQKSCEELMTLQSLSPVPGSAEPNLTRQARDVADYFGLASSAELVELNRWVAQLQNSETSLAHSAEKQLTYLNRTMHRLNQQEDRINQLAYVELGWENTISRLRQSALDIPTYLDLILTLIQGHSMLYYYESYTQSQLQEDLSTLRSLRAQQIPPALLTSDEFQSILSEAPSHMPADFAFTAPIDYLAAQLIQLPVELLRDTQTHRLYAKLTIQTHRISESFRVMRLFTYPLENPNLPSVQEIIDLPNNYVAVSANQFFSLEINDAFDCNYPMRPLRNLMDYKHLCTFPKTHITYSEKEGSYTSCSAALHFDISHRVPSSCKTIIRLAPAPSLVQLTRNVWLYEPGHEGVFRFNCPHTTPPAPLNLHPEGGHIVMPPNCEGVIGQFKIPAYTKTEYHVALHNQTHYTFRNMSAQFWISNITDLPLPEDHRKNDLVAKVKAALSTSSHLSMPLDQFKTTLHGITSELKRNSVSHFMHTNSAAPHAGTLVTVLILIAFIVGLCAIGKRCWRRYRPSRQTSPQAIPMVTFASATTPMINPAGQPTISVLPDSPEPPRSDRALVRRSRSRSRRPRATVQSN